MLNAQAVEFARDKGIAIYARAATSPLPGADPAADGTVVRQYPPRMPGTVAGVASEREMLMIELTRAQASGEQPIRDLLALLDAHGISGKRLHQSPEQLTLVISRENLHEEARVRLALSERFGAAVRIADHLGAVSIVGAGISASFEHICRGADALDTARIAIRDVDASSSRITWVIDRETLDEGVRRLHHTFVESQQR